MQRHHRGKRSGSLGAIQGRMQRECSIRNIDMVRIGRGRADGTNGGGKGQVSVLKVIRAGMGSKRSPKNGPPRAYYSMERSPAAERERITSWWLSPRWRCDYVSSATGRPFGGRGRSIIPDLPEAYLLNRTDRPTPMPGEAEVKYLDGDFRVVRPGAFVRCAVTGVQIPLEELRYWSVDLQEAYATPEAVLQRQGSSYPRKS